MNNICEDIKQFHSSIDKIIEKNVFSAMRECIPLSGGKKVRSRIYWLSCKILGTVPSENLAAAFEMIHQASLFHDDVIDNAQIRRAKPSLLAKQGAKISVLAGDMLLSVSIQTALKENSLKMLELLSSLSSNIIQGEIRCQKMPLSSTFEEYMENIYLKTGSFFETVVRAARLDNNPLVELGKNFGIYFQLIDDYKDFFCNSAETGKQQFQDLNSKTVTLPILLAYQYSEERDKEIIEKFFLKGESAEAILEIVEKIDIKKRLRKILEQQQKLIYKSVSFINESCYKEELLNGSFLICGNI